LEIGKRDLRRRWGLLKDKVLLSRLRKGLIKLFWAISKPFVRVTWCFSNLSKSMVPPTLDPTVKTVRENEPL